MAAEAVPITTIDLLRHGEPEGGLRFRGHTDDPLSALGWQQMQQALRTPADSLPPWTTVISSPLRRCHDFARHYVQQHVVYQHAGQQHAKRHKLRLRVEPRLREIHFGDWEGRSADDIEAADAAALKAFWHNPLVNMPPGSEPLADFHARVLAAWQELLQRYRGEHLLIVSHGGVIRLLLQHILAMPAEALLRVQVDHACLSRIAVHHHATPQAQLVFHGGRP